MMHIPTESRIGKKISDRITKQVISLVLVMLLILPLFEHEFYTDPPRSWDFGISAVSDYWKETGFENARDTYIDYHEDNRRSIIYMSYELDDGRTWSWEDVDPADLRRLEKHYSNSDDFVSVFDLRPDTKLEAGLNI
jgi:hypothetical protein